MSRARDGKLHGVPPSLYSLLWPVSIRRWYQQRNPGEAPNRRPRTAKDPDRTELGGNRATDKPETSRPTPEGSTYALVVQKSKALEEGRRFELLCGSDLVIGRSQNLAGIVVKDELVSSSLVKGVIEEKARRKGADRPFRRRDGSCVGRLEPAPSERDGRLSILTPP